MSRFPPASLAVAVTDDAERISATLWAARLAARHRAPLQVIHAYRLPAYAGTAWTTAAKAADAVRISARAVVVGAQALGRGEGAEVNASTVTGDPTALLEDVSWLVDMLVMGSPTVDHDDSVNVAHLVLRAGCPLVMVPPLPRGGGTVAVVSGPADAPQDAVDLAADVALSAGAKLRVLPSADAGAVCDSALALADECSAVLVAVGADDVELARATADAARRRGAVVIAVPPATLG